MITTANMKLITVCLIFSISKSVQAQTLLEAISVYPQLSNFSALLQDNPSLAGALLTSNGSSLTSEVTVLVPDNSAFTKVAVAYNLPINQLSIQQLEPYLQYHLLAGQFLSSNLTAPAGVTVPTFLEGPMYDNRSAGAALGSPGADSDTNNGQVVFLQAKTASSSGTRLVVRQLENPTVNIQGGLGHQIVRQSDFAL